jgi:hypothetical protein
MSVCTDIDYQIAVNSLALGRPLLMPVNRGIVRDVEVAERPAAEVVDVDMVEIRSGLWGQAVNLSDANRKRSRVSSPAPAHEDEGDDDTVTVDIPGFCPKIGGMKDADMELWTCLSFAQENAESYAFTFKYPTSGKDGDIVMKNRVRSKLVTVSFFGQQLKNYQISLPKCTEMNFVLSRAQTLTIFTIGGAVVQPFNVQ